VTDRLEELLAGVQPVTDLDEIAVLQEHVDPDAVDEASERDRTYFERHPAAKSYQRLLVDGELPPARLSPPPSGHRWEAIVEVTQLGFRVRQLAFAALVPETEEQSG
jgi:hypothetical protein